MGDGPRRMPSSVQQATSAAPTGPVSTTAARLAMELDDQARLRDSSSVAVDSDAASSRPSVMTAVQLIPAKGPRAISTAAVMITAPIYSQAAFESLPTVPPRSRRLVK